MGDAMTRDDFVQMARKSGFFYVDGCLFTDPGAGRMIQQVDKQLERFAALVAAAEREACIADCKKIYENAKKYDTRINPDGTTRSLGDSSFNGMMDAAIECQKAIRARGKNAQQT